MSACLCSDEMRKTVKLTLLLRAAFTSSVSFSKTSASCKHLMTSKKRRSSVLSNHIVQRKQSRTLDWKVKSTDLIWKFYLPSVGESTVLLLEGVQCQHASMDLKWGLRSRFKTGLWRNWLLKLKEKQAFVNLAKKHWVYISLTCFATSMWTRERKGISALYMCMFLLCKREGSMFKHVGYCQENQLCSKRSMGKFWSVSNSHCSQPCESWSCNKNDV